MKAAAVLSQVALASAIQFPQQAAEPTAPTRLAFLKTGRCGSSILFHELVESACIGDDYKGCYNNNWDQEVLYPWLTMHKDAAEVTKEVNETLSKVSSCTGSDAACGWSICLSCVDPHDVPYMLDSAYWKAIANIIIKNNMQVLLMTRANAVEWSASQVLAETRGTIMEKSVEFNALRPKSQSVDYEKFQPCSAYTLDGCSDEERNWVNKQKVALDMERIQYYVDHHHQVDEMFRNLQTYLRSRNEHQRILWITMEDMQKPDVWKKVYNFAGLKVGNIPEMYAQHDRYVDTVSNREELKSYAAKLGLQFD
eukprot:TRINITY_DN71951_c0_g1_i1.p1 TRINITY_DN71951_c0_g1~~TRINITY_DN71951_c0_g1_i1.p1  ORF type:complete len:310 (+),score=80.59 TRINITY_DN71951_c0_g1_i1:62-991(+)